MSLNIFDKFPKFSLVNYSGRFDNNSELKESLSGRFIAVLVKKNIADIRVLLVDAVFPPNMFKSII